MIIHAYKYQGAGNDFVIIDNRNDEYSNLTSKEINLLCDRRFGIGGDGLMLLGKSNKYDFSMRYFNSDGPEGTMCGNGGRCLVAFASKMGINKFEFEAIDGYHRAEIVSHDSKTIIVRLKMIDVMGFDKFINSDNTNSEHHDAYFLNTGSPHYVEFVNDVKNYPVDEKGKYWRYYKDFKGGTNVNFVEILDNSTLFVRTYERGVEAETFACGTGITASALSAYTKLRKNKLTLQEEYYLYNIKALGGDLKVDFIYNKIENQFKEVYLTGPATFVFDTYIEIGEE